MAEFYTRHLTACMFILGFYTYMAIKKSEVRWAFTLSLVCCIVLSNTIFFI